MQVREWVQDRGRIRMTGGSPSKLMTGQYRSIERMMMDGGLPCSIGRANAAVFPLPVSASPIRSLPCKARGIACLCIGVGA